MAQKKVSLGDITIIGYEGDYILSTIENTGDFYESAILKKWTPLLGQPTNILDIGANIGNHTIYWATHLPVQQITAFEPYPDNFDCLRKNIENNHLSYVTAVPIALGDKSGTVVVKKFDPENYGSTTFEYSQNSSEGSQAAALDDLVEQYHLQNTDFIKIDTEGFELSVLRGMSKLLAKNTPVLWIEVTKNTIVGVMNILRPLGYVLVDMDGANILCIPEEKAKQRISVDQLLVNSLSLLERVNQYYHDYEISKKWIENKNKQLNKINILIRNKDVQIQQEQTAHTQVKVKLEKATAENEKYVAELKKAAIELAREQEFLKEVKQQLQLSNARYQQIYRQNKLYEEKLNKIYCTWYGKVALKVYKVLKKVKHLIMRH